MNARSAAMVALLIGLTGCPDKSGATGPGSATAVEASPKGGAGIAAALDGLALDAIGEWKPRATNANGKSALVFEKPGLTTGVRVSGLDRALASVDEVKAAGVLDAKV